MDEDEEGAYIFMNQKGGGALHSHLFFTTENFF
jgi:hypothetical protein